MQNKQRIWKRSISQRVGNTMCQFMAASNSKHPIASVVCSAKPQPTGSCFVNLFLKTFQERTFRLFAFFLFMPAKKEMLRIDTGRIVFARALMQYIHTLWDRAIQQFPGYAMRHLIMFASCFRDTPYYSMAMGRLRTYPVPTRFGLLNLAPETMDKIIRIIKHFKPSMCMVAWTRAIFPSAILDKGSEDSKRHCTRRILANNGWHLWHPLSRQWCDTGLRRGISTTDLRASAPATRQ